MITRYTYGTPFPTDAIIMTIPASDGTPAYGNITTDGGFTYTYQLGPKDLVYGLGEQVRGINKRGYIFTSWASDNPHHHEDVQSLYGAHNFLIVCGEKTFGLFLDYPSELTFDIGFTRCDELKISCRKADLDIYVIEGEDAYDITRQFRCMIGRSYIPPKFAFGFGQCRWSYMNKEEFRQVVREHRRAGVGLDMVYMDIDYMDHYKDFTTDPVEFGDFADFVQEMKEQHVRLVPIIDAGVKIEEGYDVYEEGVDKGYFCKRADGSEFVAAVWPGYTHFPDVLNPEARSWFGDQYEKLIGQGIEAFWNDMNEPAIFHTPEGIANARKVMLDALDQDNDHVIPPVRDVLNGLNNNREDYARMYHQVDGRLVCHEDVHNLFGYNMTRAAGEAFDRNHPDHRLLIFSRSSYVGMHRYGGIWMGDNKSWWSHLLMNLQMLPSLNMCGFLYTGADLGGFGCDTSRDLMLRWLALGVFTPLMRNHSAMGTRRQEFFRFEKESDFRTVLGVRYRLLPYIYSEFVKAALSDDMMFRPLGFDFPDDPMAVNTQDQLMLGHEVMIAPVYTQNAIGRYVYLPEEMILVKFLVDGSISQEKLCGGIHFVEIALNEVALFVCKDRCIPVVDAAEWVEAVDYGSIRMIGYEGAAYELYNDDGYSRDYEAAGNRQIYVCAGDECRGAQEEEA